MPRPARITLLVILFASLLLVAPGGQAVGDEDPAAADPYWLGTYYAGLRLTGTPEGREGGAFIYGDCELPAGEGGCSPPVQVQNWSACARNPIGLDVIPYRVYLLRGGGLAAEYERGRIDVATGDRTVVVFANEFELGRAALRDIRRRSQPAPQALAPPVYPLPVLRELKRVTAVAGRLKTVKAIARETHLAPAEVRLRLAIAELLGPGALKGVPVPTMSTETVERLRQLAFRSQYDLPRAARKRGISVAALRAKLRRVRGLTGDC